MIPLNYRKRFIQKYWFHYAAIAFCTALSVIAFTDGAVQMSLCAGFMALGITANHVVIRANNGCMPVLQDYSSKFAERGIPPSTKMWTLVGNSDSELTVPEKEVKLAKLADRYRVLPFYKEGRYSLGDILIYTGPLILLLHFIYLTLVS